VTESIIDRVVNVIADEVKTSVSSYFSPVRAIIQDVRRSVEQATRHPNVEDKSFSDEPPERH
jgi:hypothetical protein